MSYNQLHNLKTPFKFQVENAIQKQIKLVADFCGKQGKKVAKFFLEN
jgi:hypothetical protein